MKSFLLILFIIVGCSSGGKDLNPLDLEIVELTPNKGTALVRQNLMHLTRVYDLGPMLFTKKIQVQTGAIPHSHPILTLNTKYAEEPRKLLSVFLHEELHWWTSLNTAAFDSARQELVKIYPKAPKGSHAHLIICYLEMKALTFYLGEKEARNIIRSFMKKNKRYPWAYYQVLNKDYAIKKVIEKYKLIPSPL